MANILVVDDEKNMRRSLSIILEGWGHSIKEAGSGEAALHFISQEIFDIILTDLVMEKIDGLGVLRKVKEISPASEVVLMSAHGSIGKAVEAMKEGAFDFIVKPFTNDYLEMTLNRLLKQIELSKTVKHLKAVLADYYPFEGIVAASASMRDVMHQAAQIADWSVPVLIQGVSGVGKELVALAIHHLSSRSQGPFVPINCGAFPDTLLDSELFGHCKGAFTGALVNKRGLIEESNGGTLFLDEIGESPPALQVRLLRFLDNGKFRRVGEVVERSSDVRVLAATNRDLSKEIKKNKFREDLFYRLSVAIISIPPLRERKEDISALCQHFLKLYSKKMAKPITHIHPQVINLFQQYTWPGNVRELENTIEHAIIVAKSHEITEVDLPFQFQQIEKMNGDLFVEGTPSLEEIQKRYILSILKKTEGNKKKAAEILEISRTTLISRLKSYKQNGAV